MAGANELGFDFRVFGPRAAATTDDVVAIDALDIHILEADLTAPIAAALGGETRAHKGLEGARLLTGLRVAQHAGLAATPATLAVPGASIEPVPMAVGLGANLA